MISVVILTALGTVYGWVKTWSDVLTAGGLLLGGACLWVAVAVYRRQSRAAKKAHEELKTHFEAR